MHRCYRSYSSFTYNTRDNCLHLNFINFIIRWQIIDKMASVIENETILPGENLIEILEASKDSQDKPTVVGPGLKRQSKDKITSFKGGQLLHRPVNLFWINSHQRYYIPCERDTVVGVVISKTTTQCRIDIGASESATLSLFAFPNATKRNKGIVDVSLFGCLTFKLYYNKNCYIQIHRSEM